MTPINYKIVLPHRTLEGVMAIAEEDNIIFRLLGKITVDERKKAIIFVNGEQVDAPVLKLSQMSVVKKLQTRVPLPWRD